MKLKKFFIVFCILNCGIVQSREDCYVIEGLDGPNSNLCTPLNLLINEDFKLNRLNAVPGNQLTGSQLDSLVIAACLDRQKKVDRCDKLPSFEK